MWKPKQSPDFKHRTFCGSKPYQLKVPFAPNLPKALPLFCMRPTGLDALGPCLSQEHW